MSYILNIGLNIPGTDKALPAVTALGAVKLMLGEPVTVNLRASDTEATLVLTYEHAFIPADFLPSLSEMLLQDCIAMMPEGNPAGGQLYGPKAAEWGPFNPAYFILPDGTRAG